MYLIVVGAGVVGASLVDIALDAGHEVVLIEEDENQARSVLQQHDIKVFQADIATGGILDEADARRADALIATTSDDSANLMAMVLARDYGIKRLISMVNERQHQRLFERLGASILLDPEVIIAQRLYGFLKEND